MFVVTIVRKMKGANFKEILEADMLGAAKDLKRRWRFTFKQDNNPKNTAKATIE